MKTLIVIPCYNEEGRLLSEKFKEHIEQNKKHIFLFVNDGSTDRTIDIIKKMHQDHPESIAFLDLKTNHGKAEAIRRGFRHGFEFNPKIIGFWDADLATPLTAINDFLAILEQSQNIRWVFGSRVKLLGRDIQRKAMRHYLGRVFATMASLILSVPVYDTQCGAKLFRYDNILEDIFRQKFISRWIFDVELIDRLKKSLPYPDSPEDMIYEYPVRNWADISGSKLKATDFLRSIYELYAIRQFRFSEK